MLEICVVILIYFQVLQFSPYLTPVIGIFVILNLSMKNISWYRITISVVGIIFVITVIFIVLGKLGIPFLPNFICSNSDFKSDYLTSETSGTCPFGCVINEPNRDITNSPLIELSKPVCMGW